MLRFVMLVVIVGVCRSVTTGVRLAYLTAKDLWEPVTHRWVGVQDLQQRQRHGLVDEGRETLGEVVDRRG